MRRIKFCLSISSFLRFETRFKSLEILVLEILKAEYCNMKPQKAYKIIKVVFLTSSVKFHVIHYYNEIKNISLCFSRTVEKNFEI